MEVRWERRKIIKEILGNDTSVSRSEIGTERSKRERSGARGGKKLETMTAAARRDSARTMRTFKRVPIRSAARPGRPVRLVRTSN